MRISHAWKIHYALPSASTSSENPTPHTTLEEAGDYWKSYFLSEVSLPANSTNDAAYDVTLIVMDSSQADKPMKSPSKTLFGRNSNELNILHGNILDNQRRAVESLLRTPCPDTKVACLKILAAHHPVEEFSNNSLAWVRGLISRNTSPAKGKNKVLNVFLSAHTHTGHVQAVACVKDKCINEINVGSLIENNPQMRMIQLLRTAGDTPDGDEYQVRTDIKSLIDATSLPTGKPEVHEGNWQYFGEFYKPSNGRNGMHQDKLSYFEQSRAEIEQALKLVSHMCADPKANKACPSKTETLELPEQLRQWGEGFIRAYGGIETFANSCTDKNSKKPAFQTRYFKNDSFGSLEQLLELVQHMGTVTRHEYKPELKSYYECSGRNSAEGSSRPYLAYAEGILLARLQDWLERPAMDELLGDYRVYAARRAAEIAAKTKGANTNKTETLSVDPL